MVCDQADRNIVYGIRLVCFMRKFTDFIADRFHRIDVKYGIYVLHDDGKTLQSHARIDILLLQFFVSALAVTVKLSKDIVPYFHETIAVAAHFAVRTAAAVTFASVIINLGTRSAGTCAMLPEIIAFPRLRIAVKPCNPFCRNADLVLPDPKRLFVFSVNGRIQSVFFQSQDFRQKFPRPGDRLTFKVISKRKVPKHFKKSQMPRRLAYIFNVSGTDAFLAGRHPASRRDLLSGKIRL